MPHNKYISVCTDTTHNRESRYSGGHPTYFVMDCFPGIMVTIKRVCNGTHVVQRMNVSKLLLHLKKSQVDTTQKQERADESLRQDAGALYYVDSKKLKYIGVGINVQQLFGSLIYYKYSASGR